MKSLDKTMTNLLEEDTMTNLLEEETITNLLEEETITNLSGEEKETTHPKIRAMTTTMTHPRQLYLRSGVGREEEGVLHRRDYGGQLVRLATSFLFRSKTLRARLTFVQLLGLRFAL
jgi:hypothetical protein